MSYTAPPYTPTGQPGPAYPYSTYQHPKHLPYAWPYGYSYQQIPQQVSQPIRPLAAAQPSSAAPSAPTAPPLTTTFSSYIPHALRESYSAPAGARSSRRQNNFRGLFTKECEWFLDILCRCLFGTVPYEGDDAFNLQEPFLRVFFSIHFYSLQCCSSDVKPLIDDIPQCPN